MNTGKLNRFHEALAAASGDTILEETGRGHDQRVPEYTKSNDRARRVRPAPPIVAASGWLAAQHRAGLDCLAAAARSVKSQNENTRR